MQRQKQIETYRERGTEKERVYCEAFELYPPPPPPQKKDERGGGGM